ncbi:MAG: choline kinase, partial [Acidobacteriota bacterium]
METNRWIEAVMGQAVVGAPALVQELWSGFGRLERIALESETVVLKSVEPGAALHPRGWSGGRSHERKLRSYVVERAFYSDFAGRLGSAARVPRFLAARETESGGQLLLEDLDSAGFSARRSKVSDAEADACLRWLAAFHGAFLGVEPRGLWPRGT